MEVINLNKNQEVQSIRLEPADNGGAVLRYELYTPSMLNSESTWENKIEVFADGEVKTVALPRILELYKADYANAMAKQSQKSGGEQPVKTLM
ncbi:hypothetical protein KA005_41140 [bacterium]|nr:hypothetical protein [bacterium]